MFTCFKKLREKCICSRDHWESLPVVFHSLIRMLDLDLSNASVSPTGDDENWMKHTLSWLDKPHVEDAKVRSPKTKSSQLSWIGGNYFFTYWRTVPFWCFRVPKKVLRVIVLGISVYPLISMAGGWINVVCKYWHLIHTLFQQMAWKLPQKNWFFIRFFVASWSPKISSPFSEGGAQVQEGHWSAPR